MRRWSRRQARRRDLTEANADKPHGPLPPPCWKEKRHGRRLIAAARRVATGPRRRPVASAPDTDERADRMKAKRGGPGRPSAAGLPRPL